jgi:hypothetical protein
VSTSLNFRISHVRARLATFNQLRIAEFSDAFAKRLDIERRFDATSFSVDVHPP